MQFQDELAGGTVLIRPALQSPDFVTGVSGWSINVDGSAEFNNVVIRGSDTEPAIVVGPDNGPQVIIYNTGVNGVVELPTNDPNEQTPARLASVVYNQGAATERLAVELQGPAHDVNSERIALQINSAAADLSTPANVAFFDVGSQNLILYMDDDRVQVNEALQVTPEDGDTNIPLFVDGFPPAGTSIAVIRRDGSNVLNINNDGNLQATPTVANASSAFFLNAASGHTGNLLRGAVNSVDQFVVSPAGVLSTYAANAFTTYTPTWTGIGTATFTQNTGWWVRIGKLIFFAVYATVNAAGSGASVVQVTAPTSIDRTTRQVVVCHTESLTAGNNGTSSLLAFQSGSGATWDRIRNSTNGSITGADLLATGTIVATGWYREA